ncbi:MAG: class I SAM-dependent methyltransferase [Blastochloris viridis]|uniref:Class I SAM-dependent methyltransferase n=1 Tax=Blastochloris viridis TaxID=1079 RepID=A0A6N4RAY4_BLAVI|nr:MAG: class I SAM-dependent methyltransferase [Blastochloris viridis]
MLLSLSTRSAIMSLPFIGRLISLSKFNRKGHYLIQTGWFHSSASYSSIDSNKNPIPWLTYPAIDFLTPRVKTTFRVFEYGSGNSTLWWAPRVKEVIAVEHNAAWAKQVATNIQHLSNAQVILEPNPDSAKYTEAITQKGKFHIAVIDGSNRVECAEAALSCLTEDGVIIWDNSDRIEYKPGIASLKNAGFRQLEFTGLAPVNSNRMETSIFYRSKNCLGI